MAGRIGFHYLKGVCKVIQQGRQPVYFWRTPQGAEIDLFWQKAGKNWGIEFKYMDAPKRTKSMQIALQDLELEHLWIVCPGRETYQIDPKITVLPLEMIADENIFVKKMQSNSQSI